MTRTAFPALHTVRSTDAVERRVEKVLEVAVDRYDVRQSTVEAVSAEKPAARTRERQSSGQRA